MKVSLKSVVMALALGLAIVPAVSFAQPPADGAGAPGGGGQRGGQNPEARLAAIETAVGTLTADQKTKITAILTKSAADMQALPQEERRAKGQEMRMAANKEIRAVLTPEQQTKFDAMPQGGRGNRPPQ